jgi:hypothetical protein
MFHVELRQFPHQACAFNLSREELAEQVLRAWLRGLPFTFQERRWDPGKAKLSIYEARQLASAEMGLGRGWANVTKVGREVTAELLAAPSPSLDGVLDALAAIGRPVTLAEALAVADESAVWQLVREGRLMLEVSER